MLISISILAPLLLLNKSSLKWSRSIKILILLNITLILKIFNPGLTTQLEYYINLDPLATSIILLSSWITLLIIINRNKVKTMGLKPSLFTSSVLALLVTLLLTFSINNIILFYILFEIALIPTLALILLWGYQPERLQASIYLMIYTTIASLPLLLIILIATSFADTSSILPCTSYVTFTINLTPSALSVWWLFCLLAFLVKIPIYTTHLWLPKAHVEAPIAGSIILAGVLLKLGGYGVIRIFSIFPSTSTNLNFFICSISLVGSLYTAIICRRQPDIKSLIAYASVSHIGLLLRRIILFSNWRLIGSLTIILAHGLASSALFALANTIYENTKTRSIVLTKGLRSITPIISLWLFIAAASNIGAPPTINLTAEIILLSNILSKSTWALGPIMLISFYTAAYSLILYTSTQHNSSSEFTNPSSQPRTYFNASTLLHTAPLVVFLIKPDLCALLTFWPRSWINNIDLQNQRCPHRGLYKVR